MPARHLLVLCWLALLALSAVTWLLGSAGGGLLYAALLLVALIKAWVITEGFMALRRAPPLWRYGLACWPLVLAGVAIASHWLG